MTTVKDELTLLREEQSRLATGISRFSFVSLALVLLFVIAFSRAYDQIDVRDVRRQVAAVRELGRISSEAPDLSYVYLLFPDKDVQKGTRKEYSPVEKMAATNSRLALEKSLEEQAKRWFTVKISALGSDLEFDLRYWIFFLPLLLWASALRLGILTAKEKAVKDLASSLVTKSDAKEVTLLDNLLFGNSPGSVTPYARQPVRIERLAYIACLIISLLYLFVEGWHFWRLWGPANLTKIGGILVGITFYLYAYCRAIRLRITSQAQDLTGASSRPRPNRLVKVQEFSGRLAKKVSLPLRRKPRLSISTGSLFVVLTLFLGTARSCESESARYKGYNLLQKDNLGYAMWPIVGVSDFGALTVALAISKDYIPFTPIGIWLYYVSLSAALLSILLVMSSTIRKLNILQMRRTIRFFYRLIVFLLLSLLADVSVGYWFCFPPQGNEVDFVSSALGNSALVITDVGRVIFSVIPFLLWLRSTSRKASPDSVGRFKSIFATIYTPVLLSVCIALPHLIYSELPGIPLLLLGLSLLALGYNELASRFTYPTKESQFQQKAQASG